MRICFELVCYVWKSTIFQGQKPTLLPFLSSEEHIKEGQIRSDIAFKLQILFDFVLVTYSFPIHVLPPALNGYWTNSMWWKGPFIFLQIFLLYFFFFLMKTCTQHRWLHFIWLSSNVTVQGESSQYQFITYIALLNSSVWQAKHVLFHI